MNVARSGRARWAVWSVTAAMVVAGSVSVAGEAQATTAGECTGPLCGKVVNRTGRTVSIVRHLGQGFGLGGKCDVWNSNEYNPTQESFKQFDCKQEDYGDGYIGGNSTGDDVDGFTYNGEGYHERFTRIGAWHWRKKGVWTKVPDGSVAECSVGDGNEIWCTVLVQA